MFIGIFAQIPILSLISGGEKWDEDSSDARVSILVGCHAFNEDVCVLRIYAFHAFYVDYAAYHHALLLFCSQHTVSEVLYDSQHQQWHWSKPEIRDIRTHISDPSYLLDQWLTLAFRTRNDGEWTGAILFLGVIDVSSY